MNELEHFGVPGMKWGVRRTPAQLGHRKEAKLNRYKEKEIEKVEKRIEAIDNRRKKYEAVAKKRAVAYKSNPNPTERQRKRYEKKKKHDSAMRKAFNFDKNTGIKEIEAIKKMPYKDMQKEKVLEGSIIAGTVLTAVGAKLYSPLPITVIPIVDMSSLKTKMRVPRGKNAKKNPNVSK